MSVYDLPTVPEFTDLGPNPDPAPVEFDAAEILCQAGWVIEVVIAADIPSGGVAGLGIRVAEHSLADALETARVRFNEIVSTGVLGIGITDPAELHVHANPAPLGPMIDPAGNELAFEEG